jgi:succinate-semialdehyde dehydrogenase/glutarate-semialdehyde dehydrogenase
MPDKQVQSINPANGEVIESFTPLTASPASSPRWTKALNASELAERPAGGARRTAEQRRRRAGSQGPEYARDITLEMGKPLSQAEAEVKKCATACRHYAEHGAAICRMKPSAPRPIAPLCVTCPWGRSWPSCRGTSRSGRSSASPPRP